MRIKPSVPCCLQKPMPVICLMGAALLTGSVLAEELTLPWGTDSASKEERTLPWETGAAPTFNDRPTPTSMEGVESTEAGYDFVVLLMEDLIFGFEMATHMMNSVDDEQSAQNALQSLKKIEMYMTRIGRRMELLEEIVPEQDAEQEKMIMERLNQVEQIYSERVEQTGMELGQAAVQAADKVDESLGQEIYKRIEDIFEALDSL